MSSTKTIVLITGIGYSTAQALALTSPTTHVLLASRSPTKGRDAIKSLLALPLQGTISHLPLDVTSPSSIAAAVATVASEHGHLDVLINNAGISPKGPTVEAELRAVLETNTIAPVLVTEAFLPLLRKAPAKPGPMIVHVTSDLGSLALAEDEGWKYSKIPATFYRMSKAALNMLTVCQHRDLKGEGFRVFAFNPGFTVSGLSGEEGREMRKKAGAASADEAGEALKVIVERKRDGEVGGYLHKEGRHP